jgi:hypothetical protein
LFGKEQEAPMKVDISLRERFGREAGICFHDGSIDLECPERMRETLRQDLQHMLKVFGGLMIAIVEDSLAEVPDRHGIMEDLMDLLEGYGRSKVQLHSRMRQ